MIGIIIWLSVVSVILVAGAVIASMRPDGHDNELKELRGLCVDNKDNLDLHKSSNIAHWSIFMKDKIWAIKTAKRLVKIEKRIERNNKTGLDNREAVEELWKKISEMNFHIEELESWIKDNAPTADSNLIAVITCLMWEDGKSIQEIEDFIAYSIGGRRTYLKDIVRAYAKRMLIVANEKLMADDEKTQAKRLKAEMEKREKK